jgi:hypothetical protein
MPEEERKLRDLVSVGPAMLEDFALLGITSVSQLRRRSPQRMYRELCGLRGQRIDPCLSRCVHRRSGPSQESATASGTMPMVVLE